MAWFTFYDPETGEILSLMQGLQEDADLNGTYIEGKYPSEEYTVVSGQAERKPDSVIEATTIASAWVDLRAMRNGLLVDSDWTQVADAPITADTQIAWQTYRQALRDLPANTTDPANPTWPTKPS